ncbi:hypothetical protein Mpal_1814 [Methanosphaerula palustris E1-9c]|uniref:Uncharacterized protein n=1 Tax=Methanosphaerula palustris (strain ATCC BAA-1556 / DSM 19958 / E1-9c) TaxID=521011 RepID=B8GK49_METPE|nr:hypothetical protein Mpal_1814 [Methanosphaerula palustris E1-9c]
MIDHRRLPHTDRVDLLTEWGERLLIGQCIRVCYGNIQGYRLWCSIKSSCSSNRSMKREDEIVLSVVIMGTHSVQANGRALKTSR